MKRKIFLSCKDCGSMMMEDLWHTGEYRCMEVSWHEGSRTGWLPLLIFWACVGLMIYHITQ